MDIEICKELSIDSLERGKIHRLRLALVGDARSEIIYIPILVARGKTEGPVLGITAAVHGNELNGLRVIHQLFSELETEALRGTIVAVPVVNMPGFLAGTRAFNDGQDLNRIMPGKADGNCAQIYAHRFMQRVVRHFDRLIDLHTASFGRVNSLYVRADLKNPETAWMARAQHPQILLHNPGNDGTLRAAAMELDIPAITVEVGDPLRFQKKIVRYGFQGVANVLAHLRMVDLDEELPDFEPVVCSRSAWMYTDRGGLLQVNVTLGQQVAKGEKVAQVTSVYGETLKEYFAPHAGIVIGQATNPLNQTGSRIIHLGLLAEDSHPLADAGLQTMELGPELLGELK